MSGFLDWARTGGSSRIVEPPEAKKDQGFNPQEPAAAQFWNWWMSEVGKRVLNPSTRPLIVGSAAQVTAKQADYTADTIWANIVANDIVLFLNGTHVLLRNEEVTVNDVVLIGESNLAILDFGSGSDNIAIDQAFSVDDTPSDNEFIDLTADINDVGVNDVDLFDAITATPVQEDYFTLGSARLFSRVTFNSAGGTEGDSTAKAWEYWDGAAWVAITNSGAIMEKGDDTVEMSDNVADGQFFSWIPPLDWATKTINGEGPYYYIRLRLSAAPPATFPIIDQAFFGRTLVVSGSRVSGHLRTANAVANDIDVTGIDSEIRFDNVDWAGPYDSAIFPLDARSGMPNWGHMVQTTTGFGTSAATNSKEIAALSRNEVAYIQDSDDTLRTYVRKGPTWTERGTGLAISGTNIMAICALSFTDVAIIDNGNDDLTRYNFNRSTDVWTQVGNSLTAGPIQTNPAGHLSAINNDTVVLTQNADASIRAMQHDGTDWAQVGNTFTITGMSAGAIVTLDAEHIAIVDGNSVTVLNWDGTDFTRVGGTTRGVQHGFAAVVSREDMVSHDSNGNFSIRRFDGIHARRLPDSVCENAEGNSNFPSITAMGYGEFAAEDGLLDELRSYKFLVNSDEPGWSPALRPRDF